jgi:hypothetical protein
VYLTNSGNSSFVDSPVFDLHFFVILSVGGMNNLLVDSLGFALDHFVMGKVASVSDYIENTSRLVRSTLTFILFFTWAKWLLTLTT